MDDNMTTRYGTLSDGGGEAKERLLPSSEYSKDSSASAAARLARGLSIQEVFDRSQRSFKFRFFRLSLICLAGYLLLSLLFYGYLLEDWGPLKGIYFAIVTLTSVGFGDLSPTNERSRLFTIFFALLGISLVALAVGQIATYIKESHEEKLNSLMHDLAAKLSGGSSQTEKPEMDRRAARREFISTVLKAFFPVILVNLIGAGLIGANEGWGAMDTLYYAVVTSTTIGYGDLHPTKRGSYWMAIIYIPSAVIAVGDAISNLVGYASRKADEKRQRELLNRAFEWEGLFSSGMDRDGDGTIDQYEFVTYMLTLWGVVDQKLLEALVHRFKELDTDGSGRLTSQDFTREERHRHQAVLAALIGDGGGNNSYPPLL